MSRLCPVSGKKGLVGNNVSHANNKTKRRFEVNLQEVSLLSEALGQRVRLRVSARGLKTIEFHGGIDTYLMTTQNSKLSAEMKSLKKVIAERLAAKSAA